MPGLEKIANKTVGKVTEKVTESIVTRLLRNAGIEDIVDNPKNYKMEFYFEDDGMTLKVKKIK